MFSKFSRLLLRRSVSRLNLRANLTVLAIESSCDDSCVAIVNSSKNVISERRLSFVESQRQLGGIAPHASSQQHRGNIDRLVDECVYDAGIRLSDLDAIACTVKPGLILCLKVGADKALALCRDHQVGFIPIHHMKAHAIVSRLVFDDVEFPFLCLLISGGHSILCVVKSVEDFEILGQTINISPGEAIDKVARAAGLIPSTHYGSEVEKYANRFNGHPYSHYVTNMPHTKGANFDFVSIKHHFTHMLNTMDKMDIDLDKFCANLQLNIAGHLCQKLDYAFQYLKTTDTFKSNQSRSLVISGGVAANSFIRSSVQKVAAQYEFQTRIPPKELVVDNAVMCAWTAIEMLLSGTDKFIAYNKLPNSVYVEGKSPIGEDLSEIVSQFKPEFRLRFASLDSSFEKLLYREI